MPSRVFFPVSKKTLKSTLLFVFNLFLFFSLIQAHGGHSSGDETNDGSGSGDNNLRSKGLILVKVYCLIIMFVSTFASGVSPYFFRWNEAFLVLGTQFSGGVFLATAMIHFLGDSNETFEILGHEEYGYAYMLACAGYVLMMFADAVVASVAARGGGGRGTTSVDVKEEGDDGIVSAAACESSAGHRDVAEAFLLRNTNFGDTLLLILALCFHSVFEGIAVGVSGTKADAWRNMWTISLHKVFGAVAMGIALLKILPKRPLLLTMAYSFAFAISSPVGIAIGIAIDATNQGSATDWTFAISMGLACGIFVYVAINHLMAKGYKPQGYSSFDTPSFKFLAVLLGVALLSVVMIWD